MNAFFDSISAFDWEVLYWIHDVFSCSFMDCFMCFCTYFFIAAVLLAPNLLLFRKKTRLDGIFLCVSSALSALSAQYILKLIFMRERPYEAVQLDPNVFFYLEASGSSFPSGHASLLFSFAAFCSKFSKKLIAPLYIAAVLTAFSRMYLFAHFPSDVIAGALIGTLFGVASRIAEVKTAKLLEKRKLKKNQPES